MIIGNCGQIVMTGDVYELLAEFATICGALEKTLIKKGFSEKEAQESIEEALCASKLSDDELVEKIKEKTEDILNILREGLI